MAAKKPKRMTQRERDARAAAKKRLQAEGILPPDKPRLNRKKFAAEVWAEYELENPASFDIWLYKAIGATVGPIAGSHSGGGRRAQADKAGD